MLRETLTAICQAGRGALQRTVGEGETRILATQVREWSFALPRLALVTVANSPVHQIYVGLSRPLARRLADDPAPLLEEFKARLNARLPVRRPIAAWRLLPDDGQARVLRGVRSFIVRQQTAAGNLYLMADLANRAEYESLRDPGWDLALAEQSLPADIARREELDEPAAMRRLTSYLLRCEHDLELLLPGDDGHVHAANAVVIGRGRQEDREHLLLSLDLDREDHHLLRPGLEVEGAFGAAGRVFRFRSHLGEQETADLEGLARLACVRLEVPPRYGLDQRRRYFRVRPDGALAAHLQCLPPDVVAAPSTDPYASGPRPQETPPAGALPASVSDLSFSGAGLMIDGETPVELARDGLVRIWFHGDGLRQPAMVTGLVRRCEQRPCGRGQFRAGVGVEFVVRGPEDRQGTQLIRQFVMAQQRTLLASRSAREQPAPA